eukprot:9504079-Pyramimonas_sp.AAC.4
MMQLEQKGGPFANVANDRAVSPRTRAVRTAGPRDTSRFIRRSARNVLNNRKRSSGHHALEARRSTEPHGTQTNQTTARGSASRSVTGLGRINAALDCDCDWTMTGL